MTTVHTRLIRGDLLESERVLALPAEARWFFISLLLTADDLGLFEATDFKLARASTVTTQQAALYLQMLADSDLVRLYIVDGKRYGFLPRFRQRLQIKRSKHPLPPAALISDDEVSRKINNLGSDPTVGKRLSTDAQPPEEEEEERDIGDSPPSEVHLLVGADSASGQADDESKSARRPSGAAKVSLAATPLGRDESSLHEAARGQQEASADAGIPDCPHLEILRLFAQHASSLPQPMPELWTGARAKNLRARWRWVLTAKRSTGKRAGERYATTEAEALGFFARFFAYVESSDFLTGRDERWAGCSLDWLVKESNFSKVFQGNYANKETTA